MHVDSERPDMGVYKGMQVDFEQPDMEIYKGDKQSFKQPYNYSFGYLVVNDSHILGPFAKTKQKMERV